jgi:5S rRNA maturation endonuclease (ribonuclease M5)
MGWQSKKPDWVRNYPIGIKKSHTLFGIEKFLNKPAVLVESPFGSYVSTEQLSLLNSVASKVIVAMDNDEAGLKASKMLFKTMPRFDDGVLWLNYKNTKAKDIGDMTDEEIYDALSTATAIPGWVL